MISVSPGFVANPDPILELKGNANWWFPKWLAWQPRLNIEDEPGLPEREYEVREKVTIGLADPDVDPDSELLQPSSGANAARRSD